MVTYFSAKKGYTLVELLIVIAIIGIIAAFAYPNYKRYSIKTKRTEMMTEMQNIASHLQSSKLVQGSYGAVTTNNLEGSYPLQGNPKLYQVTITPTPLTENWTITATPITSAVMSNDGTLTLNATGVKCRGSACGTGSEWNKD